VLGTWKYELLSLYHNFFPSLNHPSIKCPYHNFFPSLNHPSIKCPYHNFFPSLTHPTITCPYHNFFSSLTHPSIKCPYHNFFSSLTHPSIKCKPRARTQYYHPTMACIKLICRTKVVQYTSNVGMSIGRKTFGFVSLHLTCKIGSSISCPVSQHTKKIPKSIKQVLKLRNRV
jgi:hypothetical protein